MLNALLTVSCQRRSNQRIDIYNRLFPQTVINRKHKGKFQMWNSCRSRLVVSLSLSSCSRTSFSSKALRSPYAITALIEHMTLSFLSYRRPWTRNRINTTWNNKELMQCKIPKRLNLNFDQNSSSYVSCDVIGLDWRRNSENRSWLDKI